MNRLSAVLRLDDPPRRIALGLAVGVFISCTPFYGIQTLLSLLVAAVFRLHKAATLTGCWLNLPWFAPFVYGAALWVGQVLAPDPTRLQMAAAMELLREARHLEWTSIRDVVRALSAALFIGSAVVGGVAALATYVVSLHVIRRWQMRATLGGRGMMGP